MICTISCWCGRSVVRESTCATPVTPFSGRADLVAHVGQELALGAVGAFGLVARLGHGLLGALSYGDVELGGQHGRAGPVGRSPARRAHVDLRPVASVLPAALAR
jgi:hypothetical protein